MNTNFARPGRTAMALLATAMLACAAAPPGCPLTP